MVDHSRGTWFVKSTQSSTYLLFKKHLEKLSDLDKFWVSFFKFHTHGLFNYLTSELKEILGTYHVKLAIFDDNILITGANFSEEYFTNW